MEGPLKRAEGGLYCLLQLLPIKESAGEDKGNGGILGACIPLPLYLRRARRGKLTATAAARKWESFALHRTLAPVISIQSVRLGRQLPSIINSMAMHRDPKRLMAEGWDRLEAPLQCWVVLARTTPTLRPRPYRQDNLK